MRFPALAAQEDESLLAARTALQAAWDSFGQARVVHDEWERYYIENMDFAAADRLAEETCESLIGGKRSLTGKGACVERFFGAATVSGSVDHIRSITQELERRYFLKGRPGTGKSTFLKRIAAAAQENGFDVEFYRCSLDPNSCDMVLIRELGFCVFDSTAPHEYFPERPGDEEIDLYRAAVREGTQMNGMPRSWQTWNRVTAPVSGKPLPRLRKPGAWWKRFSAIGCPHSVRSSLLPSGKTCSPPFFGTERLLAGKIAKKRDKCANICYTGNITNPGQNSRGEEGREHP